MKTQNVMSQAAGLVKMFSGNSTAKQAGANKKVDAFANVMDQSLSKKGESKTASFGETQGAAKVSSTKQVTGKAESASQTETVKDVTDFQKIAEEAVAVTVTEDTSQEAMQPDDAICQIVSEITGMTPEDMENLLAELGLVPADLLNVENLQQFVVAMHEGADISVLLTDETAAQMFSTLQEQLADFSEAFDMELEMLGSENTLMPEELTPQPEERYISDEAAPLASTQPTSTQNPQHKEQKMADTQQEPVITVVDERETAPLSGQNLSEEESFGEQSSSKMDFFTEETTLPEAKDTPVSVFAQNLADAHSAITTGNAAPASDVQQMVDIVNQVVEQMKISLKPDTTSMDMMLNPESLGRLQLTVESKGGVMTANFIVQNEVAKEAVESQMQVLRDQLEEKNIKVEAVEVNVSDFDFEGSSMAQSEAENQQKKSFAGKRHILDLSALDETEELDEEDQVKVEVMKQNGSSIDYTA